MHNEVIDQSKRWFLVTTTSLGFITLAGCTHTRTRVFAHSGSSLKTRTKDQLYPAFPNEQFPIAALPSGRLKKRFRRTRVRYRTSEKPGTVIVDTKRFFLYHVERNGFAMRYGVGLGRAGFAWSGRARIAWKRKWPKWTPPDEMIVRQPRLKRWSAANGGMPPGPKNPLGARALYIFQGKKDTLYRLHGTTETRSIGRAVSSGCVRLTNHDIIHLFGQVRSGSPILVI